MKSSHNSWFKQQAPDYLAWNLNFNSSGQNVSQCWRKALKWLCQWESIRQVMGRLGLDCATNPTIAGDVLTLRRTRWRRERRHLRLPQISNDNASLFLCMVLCLLVFLLVRSIFDDGGLMTIVPKILRFAYTKRWFSHTFLPIGLSIHWPKRPNDTVKAAKHYHRRILKIFHYDTSSFHGLWHLLRRIVTRQVSSFHIGVLQLGRDRTKLKQSSRKPNPIATPDSKFQKRFPIKITLGQR